MIKLFLFLSLIAVAFGTGESIKNAIRNQVIIDFKNAIIPIIHKQIADIKLPDVKSGPISLYEGWINIHPISPGQINIQFLGGSSLKLSGNSLALHGAAKGTVNLKIIKKKVDVKVTADGISFDMPITLTSVNDKPNILVPSMNLGLASNHVHITVSGGIIAKFVGLIVNLMKGHVVSKVSNEVKGKVPKLITDEVNKIMNRLPTDIRITDKIYMKYRYPVPSSTRSDYLFTGIIAYLHPVGDDNPPPYTPKDMPEFDPKTEKGVQFFISDYNVKSGLYTAQKLNLMYVDVGTKIDNHQVKMQCRTPVTPEFNFNYAIEVIGGATCDVALDDDSSTIFGLEVQAHLILKEYIKNAVIFFSGEKLELTKVEYKILKPVDIEWFKNAINEVIAAVLVVLNGELGTKGIPLPVIHQVDYGDVIQYIGDGFMMVGTTPSFHFNMGEENLIQ